MTQTISDLLMQVPQGGKRSFDTQSIGPAEDKFLFISPNHEYSPRLEWLNAPDFEASLRPAIRNSPGISIFSPPEPDLRFKGPVGKLVDFYSISSSSYFLSNRLVDLIERIDPDSIECRPVSIKTKSGEKEFFLVMPKRHLQGVDVSRTNVMVEDKLCATEWIRRIRFPNGAVFDHDRLLNIENFTDIDIPRWFWSRRLIDAAISAGIQGLYTLRPATVSGKIDRL